MILLHEGKLDQDLYFLKPIPNMLQTSMPETGFEPAVYSTKWLLFVKIIDVSVAIQTKNMDLLKAKAVKFLIFIIPP